MHVCVHVRACAHTCGGLGFRSCGLLVLPEQQVLPVPRVDVLALGAVAAVVNEHVVHVVGKQVEEANLRHEGGPGGAGGVSQRGWMDQAWVTPGAVVVSRQANFRAP